MYNNSLFMDMQVVINDPVNGKSVSFELSRKLTPIE